MKHKKSNAVLDTVLVIIVLTVVGVVWFFSFWTGGIINTDLQADAELSEGHTEFNKITELPSNFDNLFVFVFVVLWVGALIASYNVDTHPVFFIITILLLLAVFFVSMVLGNTYEEVTTDADFTGHYLLYPKMNWIMTHLLLVAIIVGGSVTIALFAKPK